MTWGKEDASTNLNNNVDDGWGSPDEDQTSTRQKFKSPSGSVRSTKTSNPPPSAREDFDVEDFDSSRPPRGGGRHGGGYRERTDNQDRSLQSNRGRVRESRDHDWDQPRKPRHDQDEFNGRRDKSDGHRDRGERSRNDDPKYRERRGHDDRRMGGAPPRQRQPQNEDDDWGFEKPAAGAGRQPRKTPRSEDDFARPRRPQRERDDRGPGSYGGGRRGAPSPNNEYRADREDYDRSGSNQRSGGYNRGGNFNDRYGSPSRSQFSGRRERNFRDEGDTRRGGGPPRGFREERTRYIPPDESNDDQYDRIKMGKNFEKYENTAGFHF